MFSIVAAQYGERSLSPSGGAGFHQFQDDRWIQVADPETALIVVPTVIHT